MSDAYSEDVAYSDCENDDEMEYDYEDENDDEYCDDPEATILESSICLSISPVEVLEFLQHQTKELNQATGLHGDVVLLLLRHFHFRPAQLMSSYLDDPDNVLRASKLDNSLGSILSRKLVGETSCCYVCSEEYSGDQFYSLGCGHYFCNTCWQYFLKDKIETGHCFN